MHRVVATRLALSFFTLASLGPGAGAALADFGCSTVTVNGQLDPEGALLSTAFGPDVRINAGGDVLFTARPTGGREHLYRYPGAGAPEVVAPASGFAPNGGAFRSTRAFSAISINDAGDVAFHGRLVAGTGVFVRRSGQALAAAAETTGSVPAPVGGFYKSFDSVSPLNASGQLVFVANVVGGSAPSAVVLHDAPSATSSIVMAIGDTTSGGREICALHATDVGDSGAVAVRATTKLDCSDGNEVPREGILLHDGAIETVALVNDPSPVGGTTFTSFEEAPAVNAGDQIAFRATVGGLVTRSGVFVHDPAGPTTAAFVLRGDAAPPGGAVGKLSTFALDDAANVVVRSSVVGGPVRFGVFVFDGVMETAISNASAPPTDLFSLGATYLRLGDAGLSADGNRLGISVRIRDQEAPRQRRAILRCAR